MSSCLWILTAVWYEGSGEFTKQNLAIYQSCETVFKQYPGNWIQKTQPGETELDSEIDLNEYFLTEEEYTGNHAFSGDWLNLELVNFVRDVSL